MNPLTRLLLGASLILTPLRAGDLTTPLTWKPTTRLAELAGAPLNLMQFQGVKVAVGPFTDARTAREAIGTNLEKATPAYVRTKDDVPAFVAQHLRETLRNLGFPVTDKTEEATVVLTGELLAFSVEERDVYVGDIRIKLSAKAGGKLVWQGLVSGTNKRFGRSFKLENYHETLSDSLLELAASLAKDPNLLAALAGRPAR